MLIAAALAFAPAFAPKEARKPRNETEGLGTSCGGVACIPGFDKFVIGFDATTGDIPVQPSSLVDFTYSEKRTYTNPFDRSLTWGVPDPVSYTHLTLPTILLV